MAKFNIPTSKDTERVSVTGLRGIDVNSAPLDVETQRATKMRNLISRNGLNRKRYGWEQQLLNISFENVGSTTTSKPNSFGGKIQGIFGFSYAGQETKRTLVYAQGNLWEDIGNGFVSIYRDASRLKDQPCKFFIDGDNVYAIGIGDILVLSKSETQYSAPRNSTVTRLADNAYVPTTTINIACEEYLEGAEATIQRETLEPVNRLTKWRRNNLLPILPTVVNGVINSSNTTFTTPDTWNFKLDGTVDTDENGVCQYVAYVNGEEMERITETDENNNIITTNGFQSTYDSDTWYSGEVNQDGIVTLRITNSQSIYTPYYIKSNDNDFNNGVAERTIESHLDIVGIHITTTGIKDNYPFDIEVRGLGTTKVIVRIYGQPSETAIEEFAIYPCYNIKFPFNDFSIEYAHTTANHEASVIYNETGVLFGVNGHSDRLFLAGNKDASTDEWEANHIVMWSDINNYTYFPDTNYTLMGTQATNVVGLQRLNDDSLCILKEPSNLEPTLYVMYGNYTTNADGNTIEVFKTFAGNVAEGLIAPLSTNNLAGDILMLSPNGVFGVEADANVVSTARYTKERSLPIKPMLEQYTKEQLASACSIVRDGRYILCIDGTCFVADSRYVYKPKGSLRDSFAYEWYVWDNIPAICFADVRGELYFGTADGRLCKFKDETFQDVIFEDIGATTVSLGDAYITTSTAFEKGDIIQLNYSEYNVYGCIFDASKQFTGGFFSIYSNTNTIDIPRTYAVPLIIIGQKLYFWYISEDLVDTKCEATVTDVRISTNGGTEIDFSPTTELNISGYNTTTDALYIDIENVDLVVESDGDEDESAVGHQFKVSHNQIPIIRILTERTGESSGTWVARQKICNNVVCEWYSAIMDLGTPDYSKTLLGFTVVPERIEGDSVTFGYITRRVDGEKELEQIIDKQTSLVTDSPTNLDNMSLYLLSFNTFQTSFTKRVKIRNFNYLMWFFKSDSATDSAVNDVIFKYKINRRNKGVN